MQPEMVTLEAWKAKGDTLTSVLRDLLSPIPLKVELTKLTVANLVWKLHAAVEEDTTVQLLKQRSWLEIDTIGVMMRQLVKTELKPGTTIEESKYRGAKISKLRSELVTTIVPSPRELP